MKTISQTKKLFNFLSDGFPHSTDEILREVYGNDHCGLARVGGRINDLVNEGKIFLDENGNEIHGKNVKRGWKDKYRPSIYWYRLKKEEQTLGIEGLGIIDFETATFTPEPDKKEQYQLNFLFK